jgi:CheY-like chemotaxis protein
MSVNQVLVVDDEQYVCKALRKFFEGKGYTVLEAFSGEEALETYKRERPNVVMLDIRMPGMDGL